MSRGSNPVSQEDWRVIQEFRNIIHRRDGDLSYDPDFGERAECKDINPILFFPKRGQSPKKGKEVCARCPVWTDCLLYALQHRGSVDWGTYGRLSPPARIELTHQLGIKTPEIDPIKEYWGTRGWGLAFSEEYKNRNNHNEVA